MIGLREFVAMPAGGQGTGLRFAVAHHHEGYQVRMVVDRPISVRDTVAQFAALVDTARRFRRGMAADAAREGKLLEEALQSHGVFALVRIDFRAGESGICSEFRFMRRGGRSASCWCPDVRR